MAPGESDSSTANGLPVGPAFTLDTTRTVILVHSERQTALVYLSAGSSLCEGLSSSWRSNPLSDERAPGGMSGACWSSCSVRSEPSFPNTSSVCLFGKDVKELLACAVSDETTVVDMRRPFVPWTTRISHSVHILYSCHFTWKYPLVERGCSRRHVYREKQRRKRMRGTPKQSTYIGWCCRVVRMQLRSCTVIWDRWLVLHNSATSVMFAIVSPVSPRRKLLTDHRRV